MSNDLIIVSYLSQGMTMYNMGRRSFIITDIIINVYVLNYSKNSV